MVVCNSISLIIRNMNVLKFLRALRMLAFRHAPRTYHALNLSLVLFPLWYAVVCNMRLSTRIDKPDLIILICQSFCLPHPVIQHLKQKPYGYYSLLYHEHSVWISILVLGSKRFVQMDCVRVSQNQLNRIELYRSLRLSLSI